MLLTPAVSLRATCGLALLLIPAVLVRATNWLMTTLLDNYIGSDQNQRMQKEKLACWHFVSCMWHVCLVGYQQTQLFQNR